MTAHVAIIRELYPTATITTRELGNAITWITAQLDADLSKTEKWWTAYRTIIDMWTARQIPWGTSHLSETKIGLSVEGRK